jgi:single-stranded-DNA-specific exonuclease
MKNWKVLNSSKFKVQNEKFDELIHILLHNRGLETEYEIGEFLYPRLEYVTPDSVGLDKKQLQKTLQRISQTIKDKEKVIVYGDYDVDGITGTAILWETLHEMGADVMPYIPHRVDEGYGLSKKGISNVTLQMPNVKLIITVDNGIVANEAVDFANKQGIDVIITDHHVSAGEGKPHPSPREEGESRNASGLPDAYSIVHTTNLCGAGVAWLLSKALKGEDVSLAGEDTLLELATLGTIADLVPLTGANRAIVREGLKYLSRTKRKGLLALFEESGSDPTTIGVYQVGHVIGPRLNATGRMESAMDSLRLLCTKDTNRAYQLAAMLGKTNRERQQVMFQATEHASLAVKGRETLKKLLVVSHDSYPEGVIGLVAGRLVEEYYRPSIVISRGEKVSKGSVRSIQGFNIIEFLRSASDYFVNVGGHPMAAGFTIQTEKLEAFQTALEELAEGLLQDETLVRSLRIDMELPLTHVNRQLYLALQQLAPFGMGNPEPTFLSKRVEIKDIRLLGADGKHMKLLLQQDFGPILEAVAFGMGELYSSFTKGDLIDIVYTIDENTWKGNTKLQLKVKDLKKN